MRERRRVGQDDALGRGVRDVALVPQRHVLEADDGVAAQHARQAADALAGDRVALVRHRGGALLAARERLGGLAHLAALQMADLGREAIERAAEDRQRRQQLGVAVAPDHLRGDVLAAEAELGEREILDARIDVAVGADGARELADGDAFERTLDALAAAAQVVPPAEQLEPEGRRLGVHAVRAAHAGRAAVLERTREHGRERAVEAGEQLDRRPRATAARAPCRRHRTTSGRSGTSATPRRPARRSPR